MTAIRRLKPANALRAWIGGVTMALAVASVAPALAQQANGDEALAGAVSARLSRDKLLRSAAIVVEARSGTVTLTGSVPTDEARTEAIAIARATPGVVEVNDDLRLPISSPEAPAPP